MCKYNASAILQNFCMQASWKQLIARWNTLEHSSDGHATHALVQLTIKYATRLRLLSWKDSTTHLKTAILLSGSGVAQRLVLKCSLLQLRRGIEISSWVVESLTSSSQLIWASNSKLAATAWVWRRTDRWPCCPPLSNPTPCSAWPDRSGWIEWLLSTCPEI